MSRPTYRHPSGGKITVGLKHSELLERTLEFVYQSLPLWRDDPERQPAHNEEKLNSQLCAYLNAVDHELVQMIHFSHEEPQEKNRRVDMAAKPINKSIILGHQFTKYAPYLVMEGKCLPPPTNRKQREREYITSGENKTIGGGIQRFKLGKHGGKLEVAAIIGYVHEKDCNHWFTQINQWISLLNGKAQRHGEVWTKKEQLGDFTLDTNSKIAKAKSVHERSDQYKTNRIDLIHLWVELSMD